MYVCAAADTRDSRWQSVIAGAAPPATAALLKATWSVVR